jgi:hypothetical protein
MANFVGSSVVRNENINGGMGMKRRGQIATEDGKPKAILDDLLEAE